MKYTLDRAVCDVRDEIERARVKHGPRSFASGHEGIAIIQEEFEELWDHVKDDTWGTKEARKEAIQVAAMALRFAVELT